MGWSGFDSTKPTDTRRWDGADNDIRTNFAAIGSVFKDVDQYASLAAAIASIGSEVTTLSVSSSQTITANVTFPSTMTLRFHPGGVFVQDDAWTVTINGPLEAGLTQIFSGFAKGEVTFGRGAVQFVRPEWWQVNTTPGTTVMTTAMNSACNLSLPVRLLPTHYIASVIHDTGTTSLRGPGGGSESSPTAAGLPMIEAENSGEDAWTERAVAAGASWGVPLLIEDVVVNGNSKDKGGFVFGHPTTYAAGYEALGRVTIQRCAFLACTRAIYHPWGNIGNRYYDNLFRGGDYGVFV